ncbi:6-phosphogluconolactonase [Galbitalea sp. SE-J8]|uniref:6-phosphogluconolactonase n=1 Tax=Galbitalea sp. SE-J8 TaxID=3054952 RepID=UPI00259C9AE2|nr:6-phosphogluconolactonase [Galbitalea sp. SE-J8]MDM4763114.1 6-phosphogluconolactonase [Galbitalea sp. SE-J8]
MSNGRRVIVHPDKSALAAAVAARFITTLIDVIDEYGHAAVVLTGGTMGAAVLKSVRKSKARQTIDWSRVHFWWGDERWLPRGDAERNETQAREALLDVLGLDGSTVHAFPASDDGLTLDEAADAYAAELARFGLDGAAYPPFDVTFLGVGPDAHIASLFPGRSGIREAVRTVIPVRNSPKPPPERLSLTLPVINSSHRVWAVMSGADKASALGLTLADASVADVPASGAQGRDATVFFVDRDATAEVPESLMATELFWTAADSTDEF